MKNTLYFALVLFLGVSLGEPISKVYIGHDENVSQGVIDNVIGIFDQQIRFTSVQALNMSNIGEVGTAMSDMDVLFLCPGNSTFDRGTQMTSLINNFVNSGGILIYTADAFGDLRAQDVAFWLNNPDLAVQSVKTTNNVYSYYGESRSYGYKPELMAFATNESLITSFARVINHQWGLPFQWFSDPMYWLAYSTRLMQLTPNNQQFCMFKRTGYLPTLPNEDESCFVFSFPVGSGYAVQLSVDFSFPGAYTLNYFDDVVAVIQSAVGLRLEAQLFPPKPQSVALKYPTGSVSRRNWQNIIYDLSQSSNVFVFKINYEYYYNYWRRNLDQLYDMLAHTDIDALVIYDTPTYWEKNYIVLPFGSEYVNLAYSGINLVFPGNIYSANSVVNTNTEQLLYSMGTSGTQYQTPFTPPGFSSITSLPKRNGLQAIGGDYYHCVFGERVLGYEYYQTYCTLWSYPMGEGYISILGWNFNYAPGKDYFTYIPQVNMPRYVLGWPNEEWRAALTAALHPGGPPVIPTPILDPATLETETPLNVIVLSSPNTDYFSDVNMYRFLYASGHNIYFWNNAYSSEQLSELIYLGNSKDAIVLPNMNYAVAKSILPYSVEQLIRDFAYQGGNVVTLGNRAARNLNDLFFLELVPQSFGEYDFIPFTFPYGLGFQSHYTEGNLFSPYYDYGRVLPSFVNPLFHTFRDGASGNDFCSYYLAYDNYYCSVWSQAYGDGHISALAMDFSSSFSYWGFRNTYVQAGPWARVLNIAMGGVPPDPSNSPTVTPTPTKSPIPSLSSTSTTSRTGTPTRSSTTAPTRSSTTTPSRSVPSTTSHTPTVSATPCSTPIPSKSRSPITSSSVTPEKSKVLVAPLPSKSTKPSLSIGASPSPIRSAPASKSRSIAPSLPLPASASKTPGILPTSATNLNNCQSCSVGEAEVEIPQSNGNNQDLVLTNDEGEIVGTIVIPPNLSPNGPAILDVVFVSNIPQVSNVNLGSVVVDITLRDMFGDISDLAAPLEICLPQSDDKDLDNACLSFYNTKTRRWECEDECLEKVGNQYCGQTEHLTSFALLLSGTNGGGSNDPCESDDIDYVLVWLSLAFVATAICCVISSVLAVEIKYRKKQYDRAKSFETIGSRVRANM